MEWNVYNMQGKRVGACELDEDIFAGEINQPLLREIILSCQANLRQGTASTKTRAEVRGGGRKPWPQKGTGRARAGSIRSPIWVGGGITFGPKPRSFKYLLSKKKKKLALMSSLKLKAKEGKIFVVDKMAVEKGKTKEMSSFLASFTKAVSLKGKNLVIISNNEEKLCRSSSNLKDIKLIVVTNVCGYHILSHENIFFSQDSLLKLVERLKNG